MSVLTFSVVPEPMVSMAMTAATPMTMPSSVRNERSTLRRMERSARRMVSQASGQPSALQRVRGDVAVEEANDARGVAGDVGLVRDHDDGQAELVFRLRQQVP